MPVMDNLAWSQRMSPHHHRAQVYRFRSRQRLLEHSWSRRQCPAVSLMRPLLVLRCCYWLFFYGPQASPLHGSGLFHGGAHFVR